MMASSSKPSTEARRFLAAQDTVYKLPFLTAAEHGIVSNMIFDHLSTEAKAEVIKRLRRELYR